MAEMVPFTRCKTLIRRSKEIYEKLRHENPAKGGKLEEGDHFIPRIDQKSEKDGSLAGCLF